MLKEERADFDYGTTDLTPFLPFDSYGTLSFDYDNLYRLTDAGYPWDATSTPNLKTDESFTYDGVGNRVSEGPGSAAGLSQTEQAAATTTLNYDNHNRLTSSSDGASFSYNTNGHTTQKVHNGVTTDYIYNKEERLIQVQVDGATVGEYSYNPYGQRVRKVAGGQTIWFLYNDDGMAAEYDDSGNLIKEYHFMPYAPWMTTPLMQRTANGEVYYYQNDHLGTPQRMVDKAGAVVWEARYEAFGKAQVVVGDVESNLRFAGQYFDEETNTHYNYYRDYDSNAGRYIQGDPSGLNGGGNYYVYAMGNPLKYLDALGLAPTKGPPANPNNGPIAIDPKTNEPIQPGKPNNVPTREEIRPPPEPDIKVPKPKRGCMGMYNVCRAFCITRCPGGWVGKGVCLSGCLALYLGCLASGGESGF